MNTLAAVVSFAALMAFGLFLKWLFWTDPSFGFGLFTGIALMVGLYWAAEASGFRETRY